MQIYNTCDKRVQHDSPKNIIHHNLYNAPEESEKPMNNPSSKQLPGYPTVITTLPEADMPFEGVKAWIVQAPKHQLIFFEFESTAIVPEHSHPYSQWGMLIQGGMELVINGTTETITEGQEYLIPAGAKHRVKKFLAQTRVIDFFSEAARYKPKTHT